MTAFALAVLLLATLPSFAAANDARGPIVLDGVAFEAAHGGLRLLDGWGRGSRSEPFVLVEEITGDGPAILTVRNLATRFGETTFLGNGMGFVLQKIVTNRTQRQWLVFEMELREYLELPSGYYDGLSFGQANDRRAFVGSDRFPDVDLHDEPADRLAFSGTVVEPGETVMVQVTVTDHSPLSTFYIIQRRSAPLAALDER